jgi:GH15 family glucan-1,4-alpha-glucosidase
VGLARFIIFSLTKEKTAYPLISDYGVIGDSRSCALISRDGSIDWLCLPRPDSPSIFGRILDWQSGGYFQIRPQGQYETRRRYIPATNVLETTFEAREGVMTLTDFMPAQTEEAKRRQLNPLRAIIRILECKGGRVPVELVFQPRPNYGRSEYVIHRKADNLVAMIAGRHALTLRCPFPLEISNSGAGARVQLSEADLIPISLSYSEGEPAVLLTDEYPIRLLDESIEYWQGWSSQLTYEGPWREEVLRSALALKLLSYAPSGAILAAVTTSLPEEIGGERNWDYRYCWPRDAALSTKALMALGFEEEASAFFAWLLHATRLSLPRLQPLYTILGESRIRERSIEHWTGYEGSSPVRVGNAASEQAQLDVYGELLDAASDFLIRRKSAYRISRDEANFIRALADFVAGSWEEPDSGIWEPRVPPTHYTHSKVMAWVALTRAAELCDKGFIPGPAEPWRREARRIHELVLSTGFNERLQSFTQTLGGTALDASLLMLPLVSFLPGQDPRVRTTITAIRGQLERDGFLRRYIEFDDGLSSGEGAFLICNFWLVAALARSGNIEEAKKVFELTSLSANDLLILPEEYDPASRIALGNVPQALSHLGLISAALEIAAAEKRGSG